MFREPARKDLPMETDQNLKVALKISRDKMSVIVNCEVPKGRDVSVLKDSILKEFRTLDLAAEALHIDLEAWIAGQNVESHFIKDALVFAGKPPVEPQDGYIDWARDFFREGFIVDVETGTIDFRKKAAQVTVEDGELLATLVPPVEGKEGRDVFGGRVKPRKPKKAKIRAGENVDSEDELVFHAKMSGRVRWNGSILKVDNVYTVNGDVGLKTGHVKHPGALVVEGDITEGSVVTVDGDIEVKGIMEKASVTSGGAITIHGGIVGSEGTSVMAKGAVHVRYILDAEVRAGGEVLVEREIINSTVHTSGTLEIPQGRIVGGKVSAVQGIRAGQAGTEANVTTTLVVGNDPAKVKRLHECEGKLVELADSHAKITRTAVPLAKQAKSLPPEKLEAVKKLIARLKEMEPEMEALEEESDRLRVEITDHSKRAIEILRTAHQESIFTVGAVSFRLPGSVNGPIKATLRKGKVRLAATHS